MVETMASQERIPLQRAPVGGDDGKNRKDHLAVRYGLVTGATSCLQ